MKLSTLFLVCRVALIIQIVQNIQGQISGEIPSQVYTTNPVPTPDIRERINQWMSPRRKEHATRYIESVIYEPQPKVVLSRSTYKITSFINFTPYRAAFKKFEHFLNRFKRQIHDPHYVGPLFNVNQTKANSWEGPKADYFRVKCKKQAYRCRLAMQFRLIRMETSKIKKLFKKVYTKFIHAIDGMESHPSSDRVDRTIGTRIRRGVRPLKQKQLGKGLEKLSPEDFEMIRKANEYIEKTYLNKTQTKSRQKRFLIASAILGWKIHQNKKEIEKIKKNINILYQQNLLQEQQILELKSFLNLTYAYVGENRLAINHIQVKLAEINKTLVATMKEVKFIKFSISILTDARTALSRLTIGILALQQNVEGIYEYMRVLATYKVNPVMIPPYVLRQVLKGVQEDMKRNPRLRLPEDPDKNIWTYYTIMRVTPVIMENFLVIILTLPILDTSLQMNVYKVHNLPTLHPELQIQFTYELEGKFLAISKDGIYAALPSERDINICQATDGYLCMMNQALYPIEKIEWCVYALFERNYTRIGEYCIINTKVRRANLAQSLDGYMWAISPLREEKVQVRCLTETTIEIVRPPLTMLYVGNGCEAYSANIFIPAKSELTSHDPGATRHTFFLDFNEEYQNLTRYSMIEDLHFERLTLLEKETLPARLTALPPLKFNHLKKRIKPLPLSEPPFKIHPNIVLIILLIAIILAVITVGFLVWRIYKVRSRVKGFKPMARLFTGNVDNLDESVTQLLSLIKNPVSHLTKTLLAPPREQHSAHEAEPSTSTNRPIRRPQPPPRLDTLPLDEIELLRQVAISNETLQDVAKDLKETDPKTYKGYIKKLKKKSSQPRDEGIELLER